METKAYCMERYHHFKAMAYDAIERARLAKNIGNKDDVRFNNIMFGEYQVRAAGWLVKAHEAKE
jgi:hypothetical protein